MYLRTGQDGHVSKLNAAANWRLKVKGCRVQCPCSVTRLLSWLQSASRQETSSVQSASSASSQAWCHVSSLHVAWRAVWHASRPWKPEQLQRNRAQMGYWLQRRFLIPLRDTPTLPGPWLLPAGFRMERPDPVTGRYETAWDTYLRLARRPAAAACYLPGF